MTATLRAFRPDELEVVWEARRRRASPTAPVTPGTRRALERQIERSGRLHEGFMRLAIDVADPALADRIASVLADVEGLELVGKDDEPDALVVAAHGAAAEPEADVALTARELEVLTLLAEGASGRAQEAAAARSKMQR